MIYWYIISISSVRCQRTDKSRTGRLCQKVQCGYFPNSIQYWKSSGLNSSWRIGDLKSFFLLGKFPITFWILAKLSHIFFNMIVMFAVVLCLLHSLVGCSHLLKFTLDAKTEESDRTFNLGIVMYFWIRNNRTFSG